ncbi:glycosyltransferase [Candidatus Bathyarchaeota archaeon]|nr:glycosyltransferase [Candidatus Bathyarchaeota archaeon]
MDMKILQVIPYFPPAYAFGGPVKVAYQISRELVKRGHEVMVYTTDAKDFGSRLEMNSYTTLDGIEIRRFRNLSLTSIKKLKLFITPHLVSCAKKEVKDFDAIHLHEYRTFQNIVIAHYAKEYDVPYVLQTHGSLPRIMSWERLKWIYDMFFGYKLLREASKVIALSQVESEQYKAMGVPEEKIAVIPNGIDLSEYAKLPPKGSFKKKFNIDYEKIVLYLGRIHRIKGIDILVKAFADIVAKFDDVRLVVVGSDDGYLGEIEALIKALKIEDKVLITGPLYGEDKLEAYVDADVYVLPSRYETFPMGLLEAYAHGKPVIASKVGGLRDLVVDGLMGMLVKPEDVEQLAESLRLMLDDLNRARDMGLAGRRFVEENFPLERVVDKLEELYEEVIINKN